MLAPLRPGCFCSVPACSRPAVNCHQEAGLLVSDLSEKMFQSVLTFLSLFSCSRHTQCPLGEFPEGTGLPSCRKDSPAGLGDLSQPTATACPSAPSLRSQPPVSSLPGSSLPWVLDIGNVGIPCPACHPTGSHCWGLCLLPISLGVSVPLAAGEFNEVPVARVCWAMLGVEGYPRMRKPRPKRPCSGSLVQSFNRC